jgi:hypothetical protein
MNWIKIEDKLPKRGENILMYLIGYKVTLGRRYERWQESESSSWYDNERVSHWMPLPEPPKDEL